MIASATSSQPADVDASVIVEDKSISSSTKPATGDHDFSGQSDLASAKCRRCGVEPADCLHQPMPACVPANSMPESVRETIASHDRTVEQIEAAIRSEMPRQEEPRPSGEQAKPSLLSPLPWSVGTAEAEADRAVLDADGDLVAECESTKDARYIVARCNAPEPSASVPRSEVEALRDEARQQRDDWERRLELIGADHAARSAALARYRVWGCVHEDLEALLAKSGGGE